MSHARRRLSLETLERRDLLAADVGTADLGADGVLTIVGTRQQDTMLVRVEGGDIVVQVSADQHFLFDADEVQKLSIDGLQGHDLITIDPAVHVSAMVWGRQGKDDITGSSGDDELFGGNGKDAIDGFDGNDLIHGGNGKDWLDGGDGEDLLDPDNGNDHLASGLQADLDLNVAAALTGAEGSGAADWGFQDEADGIEWEFNLQVTGLTSFANSTVDVFVDGVQVGQISLDASGDGQLNLSIDPDGGEDALGEGFPSIGAGTLVSVRDGATDLLSGSF